MISHIILYDIFFNLLNYFNLGHKMIKINVEHHLQPMNNEDYNKTNQSRPQTIWRPRQSSIGAPPRLMNKTINIVSENWRHTHNF